MKDQATDNNKESTNVILDSQKEATKGKSPSKSKNDDLQVRVVSEAVAGQFVQSEEKYLHVDHLGRKLKYGDAVSIAKRIIEDRFPIEHESPETVKKIIKLVFSDSATHSIALWDGKTRCVPGNSNRVLRGRYMATINTWRQPEYRLLGVKDADMTMFNSFLKKTIIHKSDRILFLDWLSWSLQNEAQKPGFAPLLYSREKGTGKSTLCQFTALLFGKGNTYAMNGVSQITGRFNRPLLDSKLLVLEELKLKPTSNQGNALKTLITEEDATAERKGIDIEKTQQCCCFIFTTNHLPQWIEGNDRRFHVIDMGHDGHASGPDADQFAKFMEEFYEWMENAENIAKVYNALMQRKQSEDFNPKALNTSKIDTPVMKQIKSTSRETQLQLLAEKLEDDGRGAIPQGKLVGLAKDDLHINPNRLNHMMPDLGWQLEKAKWGGRDYARSIWVKPGYSVHRGRVTGSDGYDYAIDKQPGYDIRLVA